MSFSLVPAQMLPCSKQVIKLSNDWLFCFVGRPGHRISGTVALQALTRGPAHPKVRTPCSISVPELGQIVHRLIWVGVSFVINMRTHAQVCSYYHGSAFCKAEWLLLDGRTHHNLRSTS